MIKLILFIKKVHFFLLFVLLEILALTYYHHSSVYSSARIMNASAVLVGGVYGSMSRVRGYMGLRRENEALVREVAALRTRLDRLEGAGEGAADSTALRLDSLPNTYFYGTARVINNSVSKQHNYITLNKGRRDGLEKDMALIYDNAIVGYVLDCSDKFAVAISILNTDFKTSGKIKGGDYFGSIYWDGTSYEEVTFSEIPKYAQLAVGDTIETTDYSSIFPPRLAIGTVSSFEMINGTYYQAKVKLKLDMGRLKYVNTVRYVDQEEQMELEARVRKDSLE